jgi:hypothetical protein
LWQQTNESFGFTETIVTALISDSSGTVFAGCLYGSSGVFRSTNNGETWTPINEGLTSTNIQALAINSNGLIFAGTQGSGIFRSTDNGSS